MRSFEIYVDKNEVKAFPEAMHVPPDTVENMAVYLRPGLEDEFILDDPEFKRNKNKWLTWNRLNSAAYILNDDNRHKGKGEPEFDVSLTPKKGGDAPAKLDPRVVNE